MTGVQTCALPISRHDSVSPALRIPPGLNGRRDVFARVGLHLEFMVLDAVLVYLTIVVVADADILLVDGTLRAGGLSTVDGRGGKLGPVVALDDVFN